MNKKFLISCLTFFLLFYGCSEKPISEKQKAIDAYKKKQSRPYIRGSQEVLLADISSVPEKLLFDSLVISSDGKKVAYVGHDTLSNSLYLNVNQERHPSYSEIWPPIIFSPDNKYVAYITGRKKGKKTEVFVVKNRNIISKIHSEKNVSVPGVVFSPDSKNIAYAVREGGEWRVIVNGWGVGYPAFDSVLTNTVKFSSDSKTLVYGARKGDQHFIAVNGVPQKFYEGISSVILSKDNLAYIGGDESSQSVVLDGKEQQRYDLIATKSLTFSLDGEHLAYAAQKGNKQFVVIDEIEQKKYDGVVLITLSPDGKHLAYVASQGGESFVVLNGKELKRYTAIDSVINGDTREEPFLENSLVFSPDSQRFVYGVGDGVYDFLVLDGVEQKRYKSIVENSMTFSPDSQRFGYLAINYNDKPLAVVDGKEYPIAQEWAAKFCFSPDSKHFAYMVSDKERWSVVVDGEPGKYYPNLLVDERKTLFNEDGSFHYLVVRDKKIYLVEEELTPTN